VEREHFDIAIFDRNMPGIGGIEALRALRLMMRGRERLPVMMLSADVTPEAKREALDAGFDAFLAKPIEALRLLDEIHALTAAKPEAAPRPGVEAQRAASAAGDAPPVLNTETLGHLESLGSSAAFVERLIGVFLADSGALLERMEQALGGRNYHEFRNLVHAIKGSSASMGTDRLTRVCGNLGSLSDAQLRLKAPALHRTLAEEIAAARAQLEGYLRDRKKSAG
jgi:two-component system, sensor histidine kinase RpfC